MANHEILINGKFKMCTACDSLTHLDNMVKEKRCSSGHGSLCLICSRERKAEYKIKNKERILEYHALYRQNNKSKINEYNNKRRKEPKHNLDRRMSQSIYFSLKHLKKGRKWEHLVGYTVEDLMAHLESLFVGGMNWENMGDWHIDHKVPKSLFKKEDFKKCWALENLQPLWAKDNWRKNNRLGVVLSQVEQS
jgi:hypothetical protein